MGPFLRTCRSKHRRRSGSNAWTRNKELNFGTNSGVSALHRATDSQTEIATASIGEEMVEIRRRRIGAEREPVHLIVALQKEAARRDLARSFVDPSRVCQRRHTLPSGHSRHGRYRGPQEISLKSPPLSSDISDASRFYSAAGVQGRVGRCSYFSCS